MLSELLENRNTEPSMDGSVIQNLSNQNNRTQNNELLFKNFNKKSLESVEYIKSLLNKYPYFSFLYTILAKILHSDNSISKKKSLEIAAIYSSNRIVLKNIMTGSLDIDIIQNNCTFEHLSFFKALPSINNKKVDFNKETITDGFITQEPFTKKNKKISSSTSAFSEETFKKETKTPEMNLYVDDSIYPDAIISESLAKIMEKQEKYELAKRIYNRLIKKFPEKKTYFVHKINKLT